MNLASVFLEQAEQRADAPALRGRRNRRVVRRTRRALGRGARGCSGRAVSRPAIASASMLPNGPAFVALLFGAWRLGAVVVPLNVLLAEPEVDARVAVASTKVLIRDGEELESGEPLRDVIACDSAAPAVILFTSGTSGEAEGRDADARQHPRRVDERRGRRSSSARTTSSSARRRSRTCSGCRRASSRRSPRGGAIAVERRFDARQTLDLMTELGTTVLLGVPTMCIALSEAARSRRRLPPLRIAHVGGAAVPAEVGRDVRAALRGRRLRGLRDDGAVRHRDDLQRGPGCGSSGRSGFRSAAPSSASSRPTSAASARCGSAGRR